MSQRQNRLRECRRRWARRNYLANQICGFLAAGLPVPPKMVDEWDAAARMAETYEEATFKKEADPK